MKKKDNFKPLADLTIAELQQLADRMLRYNSHRAVPTDGMTRRELIEYIESMNKRWIPKPRPKKGRRMPKNLGVGKWCRAILAEVIGQGPHGPIGHSYTEMVKMAQKKWPLSAVDERHLRWYATKARGEGIMIPSDRPRSSWKHWYIVPKKKKEN